MASLNKMTLIAEDSSVVPDRQEQRGRAAQIAEAEDARVLDVLPF